MNTSYFRYLCYGWAAVGIITRILMVGFGDKWNEWEMKNAYSEKKPRWIYVVAILGLILVGFTWYMVFTTSVNYSWIIALLVSLTLVKITNLIFNYEKFREFASTVLNDPKKKMQLTISVFIMSIVFILLGYNLY